MLNELMKKSSLMQWFSWANKKIWMPIKRDYHNVSDKLKTWIERKPENPIILAFLLMSPSLIISISIIWKQIANMRNLVRAQKKLAEKAAQRKNKLLREQAQRKIEQENAQERYILFCNQVNAEAEKDFQKKIELVKNKAEEYIKLLKKAAEEILEEARKRLTKEEVELISRLTGETVNSIEQELQVNMIKEFREELQTAKNNIDKEAGIILRNLERQLSAPYCSNRSHVLYEQSMGRMRNRVACIVKSTKNKLEELQGNLATIFEGDLKKFIVLHFIRSDRLQPYLSSSATVVGEQNTSPALKSVVGKMK